MSQLQTNFLFKYVILINKISTIPKRNFIKTRELSKEACFARPWLEQSRTKTVC